jgi:trk system potassium uptake protein TrkH
MFFAEAPGPTEEKFTPRIKNTASALWIVYAALTGLCALCLWSAGMPIFDSVCNAFSTLAAGGFSPNPRSIGGYNSEIIIYITMFFMFVAGTSFVIQSKALAKFDIKLFWKSEEFRFYLKVILFVSFILAILLLLENHYTPLHAMTASLYQVLSLSTSTGSSSEDYHLWSLNAKLILFLSMFISSCAGSAGGGVKITRWLLLFKYMKNEMYKILHPNAVLSIKLDRRVVSNDVLKQTLFFMFCFFIIFGLSALLITLKENNLVIGVTSSIASLGGVGPAFGHIIGPMGNYSTLAEFTKIILIINMLVGRLEIIPFLVLFHKDFWTKG